jgi:SAM-dependent methyltransferase
LSNNVLASTGKTQVKQTRLLLAEIFRYPAISMSQTGQFSEESQAYLTRHVDDGHTMFDNIVEVLGTLGVTANSILDVGCGNGANLAFLSRGFSADQGVGVEPSRDAVAWLSNRHRDAGLEFEIASAHSLPFDSDSFDLVVCWSVLHWVGRNEYLQAIGELVRVTSGHLVIMDFCPSVPYRAPYHHKRGLYTFKSDFEGIVTHSDIMTLAGSVRFWKDPSCLPTVPEGRSAAPIYDVLGGADLGTLRGPSRPLASSDLKDFSGNRRQWWARKMCLWRKTPDLLPVHSGDFFGD